MFGKIIYQTGIVIALTFVVQASNKITDSNIEPLRPFTVADSIGMSKLVTPGIYNGAGYKLGFSPDGKHVVIVVQRGNLESGRKDATLVLYKTGEILAYVNHGFVEEGIGTNEIDQEKISGRARNSDSLPLGKILVRMSSVSNSDPIRSVRWLTDSETLAFIGESEDHFGQVYSVNIYSKKIRRLTNHPRSVVSYDMTADNNFLLYISAVSAYHEERGQSHFIVDEKRMYDVMNIDREKTFYRQYQYYSLRTDLKHPARPVGKVFRHFSPKVWLSPKGKWAIGQMIPSDLPRSLLEFEPITDNIHLRRMVESHTPTTFIDELSEFVLIDMENSVVKSLWKVPSGESLAMNPVMDVHWLEDNRMVLSSTLLPLDVKDKNERKRRRQALSIVEVNITDIENQKVWRIAEVPHFGGDSKFRFTGTRMSSDGRLTVKRITRNGNPLPSKYYRRIEKQGNVKWIEISETDQGSDKLILTIHQNLDTPPEILAKDTISGNERIITDLNPQFRNLTFGQVRKHTWSDNTGRDWIGGLVYPPGYRLGKRYPLVIQTGFEENNFLIDGTKGIAGPYAAQALANAGIMVLQMQDAPSEFQMKRIVMRTLQNGVESAIDDLDHKKLIDRKKVGLIGYSATASQIYNIITFSEYEFAAATIADSTIADLYAYILLHGYDDISLNWVVNLQDALPWGQSLPTWTANSPILNSDRVITPLRIEQFRDYVVPHFWDVYAVLRRQKKPVEYLVIRDGAHPLQKPTDIQISQQGNVDWFAFWLKDEEDDDPTKNYQYLRWKELRRQHQTSKPTALDVRRNKD